MREFHLLNWMQKYSVIPLERGFLGLLVPAYTDLKGSYDEKIAVSWFFEKTYRSIHNSKQLLPQ